MSKASHICCCRTSVHEFYELGRSLNKGLSAEVLQARHRLNNSLVAVKVYHKASNEAVHEAITEHVCMSRIQSEHVMTSYGIMFDERRPCLVLPLATRSLRDLLLVRPLVHTPGSCSQRDMLSGSLSGSARLSLCPEV